MYYIGLDIHKAFTLGVIKDAEGNELRKEKFENSKSAFGEFLEGFPPEYTQILMESTCVWEYIYDILDEKGYKTKLANPTRTKAIAYARIKTDAIDAATLADLLRANLVAESYIPSKEYRKLREVVRQRKIIVKGKTQVINKIRAILLRHGVKTPYTTMCLKAIELLKQEVDIKDILQSHFNILEQYNNELKFINANIEKMAETNNDAKILMSAPGIGATHAMEFIAEVADINRFRDAPALCSYAGMVPGIKQSGNTLRMGRLIKQANSTLKNIAIQASWSAVRKKEPNPLKDYYLKLSKKKSKQKAICATARKLLYILYAMLHKKEEYRA